MNELTSSSSAFAAIDESGLAPLEAIERGEFGSSG